MRSRSARTILSLLLLAAVASCRGRQARTPTGALSLIEEAGGHHQVVLLDLQTGKLRGLTSGPADHFNGPASPDGRGVLVIAVDDTGGHQLEVYELPHGAKRPVGPRLPRIRTPVYSPDGAYIYFEGPGAETGDLYRVRTAFGELERLTNNPEGNFAPRVSPKGDEVVFQSSRDRAAELYRMRMDGSGAARVTFTLRDEWDAEFSADGRWLAFLSDRSGADRLYVMSAAGDEPRRVGEPTDDPRTVEEGHSWAPAGRRLCYVRRQLPAWGEVVVLDLDAGTSVRRSLPGDPATPLFLPDGAGLVTVVTVGDDTQLYLLPGTGEARRLTSGPASHWNPRQIPAPR